MSILDVNSKSDSNITEDYLINHYWRKIYVDKNFCISDTPTDLSISYWVHQVAYQLQYTTIYPTIYYDPINQMIECLNINYKERVTDIMELEIHMLNIIKKMQDIY